VRNKVDIMRVYCGTYGCTANRGNVELGEFVDVKIIEARPTYLLGAKA
jgi:hypothetical protein